MQAAVSLSCENKMIRTRFAPSPTGFLHIGGVRTAIFNWAYAKKHGGKFYLRIDDTDRDRHVEGAVEQIVNGFKWLGLNWDIPDIDVIQGLPGHLIPISQESILPTLSAKTIPGLMYQSLRSIQYFQALIKLEKCGFAYKCTCTQEELEEDWKNGVENRCVNRGSAELPDNYCYRLNVRKVAEGEISFVDQILGEITTSISEIKDFVLIKSDGGTVYSFATVIDDADLGITHVIRGQEHVSNTFPQLLLYKALRHKPPVFAHIPFICSPPTKQNARQKLSKRSADELGIPVYLSQYQSEGYLSSAIFNYLTHLGWSMDDSTEKWDRKQFVDAFELSDVIKSPAIFDLQKLHWLQGEYFKELSIESKCDLIRLTCGIENDFLPAVVEAAGDRLTKATDIQRFAHFWNDAEFSFDPQAVEKRLRGKEEILRSFAKEIQDWKATSIESFLNQWCIKTENHKSTLIHALRVATTGSQVGFSLYHGMEILGKDRCLDRINRATEKRSLQ